MLGRTMPKWLYCWLLTNDCHLHVLFCILTKTLSDANIYVLYATEEQNFTSNSSQSMQSKNFIKYRSKITDTCNHAQYITRWNFEITAKTKQIKLKILLNCYISGVWCVLLPHVFYCQISKKSEIFNFNKGNISPNIMSFYSQVYY